MYRATAKLSYFLVEACARAVATSTASQSAVTSAAAPAQATLLAPGKFTAT